MSERNRRQFLQESMLATAAMAARSPTALLGDSTFTSSAPSQRVGLAVIGLGGRGRTHVGALAGRRGTEILYLCDADREQARRGHIVQRRQRRAARFVQDFRYVLDDPRVDAVTIATPDHWHALMAVTAMEAGKHVYVEAPVSHSVQEGLWLIETAQRRKRICQSGLQCRFSPAIERAMDWLSAERLGSVHRAYAYGSAMLQRRESGPCAIPATVDYSLWLGPAPPEPLQRSRFHYDWRWQWAYGSGVLGNHAIHQIDVARWGLDLHSLELSVIACGGRYRSDIPEQSLDAMVVEYTDGNRSLIAQADALATPGSRRLRAGVIFECDGGYLAITSYHGGAAFDFQGRQLCTFTGAIGQLPFQRFIDAIQETPTALEHASIEQGHLSSALCHLGNISIRLGSELAWQDIHREDDCHDVTTPAAPPFLTDQLASLLRERRRYDANATLRQGRRLAVDAMGRRVAGDAAATAMLRDARRCRLAGLAESTNGNGQAKDLG